MRAIEHNTHFLNTSYISRHHIWRAIKAGIIDFAIVVAAYTVAFWGRVFITALDYIDSLPFIMFSAIVIIIMLYLFGVYQRIWRHTSGHDVTIIINAVAVATLIVVLATLSFQDRPLPLSVIVIGNILTLGGITAVRYQSRIMSGASWRWRAVWHQEFPEAVTRVLVVGAGNSGQALTWRMKHRAPEDGRYKVVGFVDDDPYKQNMYLEGSQVLGRCNNIPELTEKHKVDLIVVAIHNIDGPQFRNILSFCERTKVRIKVAPDVFAMMDAKRNIALLRDVQPDDLIGRSTVERHHAVDMKPVIGKVVLVTGAAGSIGSELSRQMADYDLTQLILLDSNESGLHDLYIELTGKFPNEKLVQALVDITDKAALEAIYATYNPQVVFHAAAYKHVPVLQNYPDQAVRVNIGGTRNLVDLSRTYNVERFVLISTDKAVNPSNVMGATKRICELLLGAYAHQGECNTLFTSVRFGNVLGSRGSVVPTFNRQIDNGGPVTVTHPDMTRYFLSIPEAVNLVIHAACMTKGRDIFLLKMGEVVRIMDLAERMIRLRGLRPHKDIEIQYLGIRPGEKLHEELYTEMESVTDTEHPYIIKLQEPYAGMDRENFLKNVEYILHNKLDKSEALDQLRELIGHPTLNELEVQPILPETAQLEMVTAPAYLSGD